jgi:RimJ/RimL family protein N-acetyltransferase
VHRRGELGIVVGFKEDWGKGYGGDAIVTCLGFAFLTLGLHGVSICAHEEHQRGLKPYRRIGFVETGRERERVYQNGRFSDYILFDMLDSEYRARYCSKA